MAYVGNVVDLWERLAAEEIPVDLGSDQTSLHNPWAGGYYPVGVELRGVEQDDGRGAGPLSASACRSRCAVRSMRSIS